MRRRVFDAFLFSNELDLLEARLIELQDAVDYHIVVESAVTFQGAVKPLWYEENKERFAPWKDKIVHVSADLGGCTGHWEREHASRDAVRQGLAELGDDDIFMLSDADEIPQADVIQRSPGNILMMRHHTLAVNLVEAYVWAGTISVLGRDYQHAIRRFRDRQTGADRPYVKSSSGFPVIAGGHFSWLGGPDEMRAKAHSFSHVEMAEVIDENAERMYKEKFSPTSECHVIEAVIDASWPKYMQDRRGPKSWYWPGEG